MGEWMRFRERATGREALAKQMKDGRWMVKLGRIARSYSAAEFEKKYEAAS